MIFQSEITCKVKVKQSESSNDRFALFCSVESMTGVVELIIGSGKRNF